MYGNKLPIEPRKRMLNNLKRRSFGSGRKASLHVEKHVGSAGSSFTSIAFSSVGGAMLHPVVGLLGGLTRCESLGEPLLPLGLLHVGLQREDRCQLKSDIDTDCSDLIGFFHVW